MSQNLAELKVVELRAELSKRGLPTTGNKAELVARLQQAVEAEKAKEEQEKAAQQSASELPSLYSSIGSYLLRQQQPLLPSLPRRARLRVSRLSSSRGRGRGSRGKRRAGRR